jgi:hypothetical protein
MLRHKASNDRLCKFLWITLTNDATGCSLLRDKRMPSRNFKLAQGPKANCLAFQSEALTALEGCVPARGCPLFRALISLLFLGLVGGIIPAKADVQNPPAVSVGPGPQFAVADFDGDVRPDLASIQPTSNSIGSTDYWIQLQMAAGGRQSIRLFAPAGGLRIEARDVNGDHAIDLILATAWLNEPVAILLNNGHGSFSRVEAAAFPGLFSEATTNWAPVSGPAMDDAIGVPPQSQQFICSEARVPLLVRSPARSNVPPRAGFLVSSLLNCHAGRAPPCHVHHL